MYKDNSLRMLTKVEMFGRLAMVLFLLVIVEYLLYGLKMV